MWRARHFKRAEKPSSAMIVNIAGHRVTALIRSEASAIRLPTGDVRIVAGSVEVLDAVERGLESAGAAMYLAMQGIQGASDADRGRPARDYGPFQWYAPSSTKRRHSTTFAPDGMLPPGPVNDNRAA